MALVKTKETTSGVNATYWKIVSIHIMRHDNYLMENNFNYNNVNVSLAGYYDKEARYNNKTPLETINVQLNALNSTEEELRNSAYELLKSQPEWADATDV